MPYPPIQLLGSHGTRTEDHPYEWNVFQTAQLQALFMPKVRLVISETAVRTGKTGTQAAFHRYMAKKHPGVLGIWIVESYKWYTRIAKTPCRELFGHEAEWHGTDHTWTWPAFQNSKLLICTYQDLQSMQGATAGWGSIDEFQNMGIDAYYELEQRISDRRVEKPVIYISGLPEFNSWAFELAEAQQAVSFEQAKKQGGAETILFTEVATDVNADNLMAGFDKRLKESLDEDEYQRRLRGLRPLPTGTVFKHWSPDIYTGVPGTGGNIYRGGYDPQIPVHLDIDFGFRRCGIIATMVDKARGIDIMFDEFNFDDMGTEDWCQELIKVFGRPGSKSKYRLDGVCCDPAGSSVQTAEAMTDIRIMRQHFPWAEFKYSYDSRLRNIANGIGAMSARIRTASGHRRLLMTEEMWNKGLADKRTGPGYKKIKRGRSAALSLTRTKYPEDKANRALSNEPLRCPIDSHCLDAMRYGVVNRHGVPDTGGSFIAR